MRYLGTTAIIATTCAVAATLATTTALEQVETVPATSCESLASLVLSNTTITPARSPRPYRKAAGPRRLRRYGCTAACPRSAA